MPTPDIFNQLVTQQLGAPPGAPPQGAAPEPDAKQQPPRASDAPTNQEKAAAKVAPTDAGSEPSFEFIEIDDDGGEKRQLTRQQIKGTFDRYRDLNHKWQSEVAPLKPVLEVVKQIMGAAKANGHDASGDEVAKLVDAAVRAYVKNPRMGGDGKKPEGDGQPTKAAMSDDDEDAALENWAKENAVTLPPGLKEQGKTVKALNAKLDQVIQLMMAQKGGQQLANNGTQALQAAGNQRLEAARQAAKNNMQMAMQQAGLTAEDGADLMHFAQARGYSPEDFLDPELTSNVVNDFKANRQAPEIARLREVAQRRQAFTGSVSGAPGGGGAPAPQQGDPMFSKLLQAAMAQHNMA